MTIAALGALLVLSSLVTVNPATNTIELAQAPVAEAQGSSAWFEPGKPYNNYFADPSVFLDKATGTFWAYATNTGGAYLPAASSTSLQTWIARPAYGNVEAVQPADENHDNHFNDALVKEPSWAVKENLGHPHLETSIWAPGVARINGRYVAYFSVRCGVAPGTAGAPRACWSNANPPSDRFCIGVATSPRAEGPFVNKRSTPLTCSPDLNGAIDPDPFFDRHGRPWLMFKSEGVPGQKPTRLWARRLHKSGTRFAAGSTPKMVLETQANSWEGNVIENPSMVWWPRHQVYVLLYSGNEWRSANYSTGYAICSTPTNCFRRQSFPLLQTSTPAVAARGLLGPGGADAFLDKAGRLRVAFHAYDDDSGAGPSQLRRLHTLRLAFTPGKQRLVVA